MACSEPCLSRAPCGAAGDAAQKPYAPASLHFAVPRLPSLRRRDPFGAFAAQTGERQDGYDAQKGQHAWASCNRFPVSTETKAVAGSAPWCRLAEGLRAGRPDANIKETSCVSQKNTKKAAVPMAFEKNIFSRTGRFARSAHFPTRYMKKRAWQSAQKCNRFHGKNVKSRDIM